MLDKSSVCLSMCVPLRSIRVLSVIRRTGAQSQPGHSDTETQTAHSVGLGLSGCWVVLQIVMSQ